uniref:ribosomal protein L28 n=1 Tax=Nemalion vermiculare TaxID=935621 RepID=UPI00257CC879|nr:ribosomal protein L28 [Nemalion vermiculare]WGV34464.1 ribosomal protein L28 [Nemalion vermiculare]
MSKICKLTGKKRNNGYAVSHSHVRNKKIQNVNLQSRKVWLSTEKRWIRIKISTKAMKTLLNNQTSGKRKRRTF